MVRAIYANTWNGLTVKMLGYHHDHCRHYYNGPVSDLPLEYKKFRNTAMKYVFIYEEDEPYIPENYD